MRRRPQTPPESEAAYNAVTRLGLLIIREDKQREKHADTFAKTGSEFDNIMARKHGVRCAAYEGVAQYAIAIIRNAEQGGTGYPKTPRKRNA